MRILVVGAGAIGGYFGGRLLEAGRDVTFLVRQRRAAELAKSGLVIKSAAGNLALPSPPMVLAERLSASFDLILLSCKAYDLDGAIASFAPAVGPGTAILPLLNGMRHLDILEARFGRGAVLGGLCYIAATLTNSARSSTSTTIMSSRSGSAMAGRRTVSAPSPAKWPASSSRPAPARKSCRTCGRNGCSWRHSRVAPA